MRRSLLNHLVSTCNQAVIYLEEVRSVAATGEGADGTRYTVPPPELQEPLVAAVDELLAELQALADKLEPQQAAGRHHAKSLGSTLMWLSTLLYMAQEQIEELDPERVSRRYGNVTAEQAALLRDAERRLVAVVRGALAKLPGGG